MVVGMAVSREAKQGSKKIVIAPGRAISFDGNGLFVARVPLEVQRTGWRAIGFAGLNDFVLTIYRDVHFARLDSNLLLNIGMKMLKRDLAMRTQRVFDPEYFGH